MKSLSGAKGPSRSCPSPAWPASSRSGPPARPPLRPEPAHVAASGPAYSGAVGAPIAWGACDPPGEGLECARIRVPLDWDRPNGRTISLALIRHLASKPEQRIGTLFINPGGPG